MRVASTSELEHYYDTLINAPIIAVAFDDGEGICSVGGLAWEGGVCWLFMDIKRKPDNAGLKMRSAFRHLMSVAKALGETEVYVSRDKNYETSGRILSILGFKPHKIENGVEICRV